MYEVRPENSIHRVDSDTSLARAVSKAEAIAKTNRRSYVVVEVKTVHVVEPPHKAADELVACNCCGFWHLSNNPCLLPTGR